MTTPATPPTDTAAAMRALFECREDAQTVADILDQHATNDLQQALLYGDADARTRYERLALLAGRLRDNLDDMEQ